MQKGRDGESDLRTNPHADLSGSSRNGSRPSSVAAYETTGTSSRASTHGYSQQAFWPRAQNSPSDEGFDSISSAPHNQAAVPPEQPRARRAPDGDWLPSPLGSETYVSVGLFVCIAYHTSIYSREKDKLKKLANLLLGFFDNTLGTGHLMDTDLAVAIAKVTSGHSVEAIQAFVVRVSKALHAAFAIIASHNRKWSVWQQSKQAPGRDLQLTQPLPLHSQCQSAWPHSMSGPEPLPTTDFSQNNPRLSASQSDAKSFGFSQLQHNPTQSECNTASINFDLLPKAGQAQSSTADEITINSQRQLEIQVHDCWGQASAGPRKQRRRAIIDEDSFYEIAALAHPANTSRLKTILRHFTAVASVSPDHRPMGVPHFDVAAKVSAMAARLYLHRCREEAQNTLKNSNSFACWLVTDGSRVARRDFMIVNIYLGGKTFVGLPQVSGVSFAKRW